MLRTPLISATLALGLLLSRSADGSPALSLLTVRVKDRHSGLPVDGAVVLLDGDLVGHTGAGGDARIVGITPGRHLVSVMSASHHLSNEELKLSAGETRDMNFAVVPSTTEEITIVEKAAVDRAPVSEVGLSRDEVTRVAGTGSPAGA